MPHPYHPRNVVAVRLIHHLDSAGALILFKTKTELLARIERPQETINNDALVAITMREVRVRWKKASLLSTDLGKLVYGICDSFEVAAHLEHTPEGLSTIAEIHFRKGKSIEDFGGNPFFRFKMTINS